LHVQLFGLAAAPIRSGSVRPVRASPGGGAGGRDEERRRHARLRPDRHARAGQAGQRHRDRRRSAGDHDADRGGVHPRPPRGHRQPPSGALRAIPGAAREARDLLENRRRSRVRTSARHCPNPPSGPVFEAGPTSGRWPGCGKCSSNPKTVATPQDQLPNTADLSRDDVLSDYRIAYLSRQMSVVARREVHAGRAKFGIFGDGKEIAQVALARAFQAGDWRSGYYRDQTLMMALGLLTPTEYFAQLYAHADIEADPASGGRSMGGHFGTRLLDEHGKWKSHMEGPNSSADVSPTGEQMPRLVGLGYASRIYRELESLHSMTEFSQQGNEVVFGTIGNASCAEGLFWESLNAIGVLQAPVVVSIWDDGYGISVPNELQVLGGNLTQLLQGSRRRADLPTGYHLHTVRGWDYEALLSVYRRAADNARHGRIPAIVHVIEMTQPQGHSTSGSHERYKPKERLEWEVEFDPIKQMRAWMIEQSVATDD